MDNKIFTITDLERFSGIKAHTLRIWERRYAVLAPVRSAGNFRVYTLDEVKKILNIALLKRNGHRISHLCKNDPSDLDKKIGLLQHNTDKWQKGINDLTINMYAVDPESFEWVLDELLMSWPIDILIEKIIYPFLKLTKLLWIGHKLCEEHLVVTATRKKLILAIESTKTYDLNSRIVILFLPDSTQLDLGLLYSNYYLKRNGIHVIYLGNDVSVQNIKSIIYCSSPAFIFTYLHPHDHFEVDKLSECINTYSPETKLVIGSYSETSTHYGQKNVLHLPFNAALEFLRENAS